MISSYRPHFFFIAKLILFYGAFYLSIIALIGLTSEEGSLYSPWVKNNFDIVAGFRQGLLAVSQKALESIGYETNRSGYDLRIADKSGIRLVYGCLGFELISGYTALVLAYPFAGWRTILFIALGIVLINVLNVVRIVALTILFSNGHTGDFNFLDHHDLFNIAVVICLLVVYHFYLKRMPSST